MLQHLRRGMWAPPPQKLKKGGGWTGGAGGGGQQLRYAEAFEYWVKAGALLVHSPLAC